ncbi:MAG: DUF4426 domain-containing protein [Pseudomonadota bacterium]
MKNFDINSLLLPIFSFSIAFFMSGLQSAFADKQDFGDITVHYSAFGSDFLSPEVSKQYGIRRSDKKGVLNISVLKKSMESGERTPITASVTGELRNVQSAQQITELDFTEVQEGSAIYYLSTFDFGHRDDLNFKVIVKTDTDEYEHTVKFSKKLYHKK